MVTEARFIAQRAQLGNPAVWDMHKKRWVAVMMRDTELDPKAADEEAMRRARLSAQAYERDAAEQAWKKEAGK